MNLLSEEQFFPPDRYHQNDVEIESVAKAPIDDTVDKSIVAADKSIVATRAMPSHRAAAPGR
jgi:hypothetical protein